MQLKIKPINIEKSETVNGAAKNIKEVLAFQVSLASELNRVIAELSVELEAIDSKTAPQIQIDQSTVRIDSMQKEINSNRNECGTAIDKINQRLNTLTGEVL